MSRRASSESTGSGTEEIDRITCEDREFRCREIVASRFHANDPLLAAAQRALVQSGDDIDEEVVPYINALRIVHGDDHSAVAAYDRVRLTDAGALRSAKARLRKCPMDRTSTNTWTALALTPVANATPGVPSILVKAGPLPYVGVDMGQASRTLELNV